MNPKRRKRSSLGGSRKSQKSLVSSTLTESSSSGIKSMKERTQSSSDEDTLKGSFETRMRHRRRRLNKSKAFVQTENTPGFCGSDSKMSRFSAEKMYLQKPESQETLRPPLNIMSTSAPAGFPVEKKQEETEKTTETFPSLISLSPVTINVNVDGSLTRIPENTSTAYCPEPVEVDIESSDTLVPEPDIIEPSTQEIVVSLEPILENLRKPNESLKAEKVIGVSIKQTIDFSGLEEFSVTNELGGSSSLGGKNIIKEKECREVDKPHHVQTEPVGWGKEANEQQPAANVQASSVINGFLSSGNKEQIEFSNFGGAGQKTEVENDCSLGKETTAVWRENILGSSSDQKEASSQRNATPRGAKRIVVLHSGPNETTVYEKIPVSFDESKTDGVKRPSSVLIPSRQPTKNSEVDEIKIREKSSEKKARPSSWNDINCNFRNNTEGRSPDNRRNNTFLHTLPSVEKEVEALLNLGEELNSSRHSLNTDSETGFKTPEIHDLPVPKKATVLNTADFNCYNEIGSGHSTPTLQKRGSFDSLASFMTADSQTASMKDLTFVLTARPQPFRTSTENISRQKYQHVDPKIPAAVRSSPFQRVPEPLGPVGLQRTASATSNDSWMSAASGNSASLDVAAKKVDEMLRLARRKHQENRSRFRDAMDHLDHIYEEIRKEAEDVGTASHKNSNKREQGRFSANQATFDQPVFPKTMFTQSSRNLSKQEVPLYENIYPQTNQPVAPIRDGKFDFTKKWLEDDLRSLATDPGPKPDLLQFGPSEADQHSVGSASAEIAAITGKESLTARKVPDLVPQKHQAVIKPSPVRYASFQDVSAPNPPVRKDSLSSIDSARMKGIRRISLIMR